MDRSSLEHNIPVYTITKEQPKRKRLKRKQNPGKVSPPMIEWTAENLPYRRCNKYQADLKNEDSLLQANSKQNRQMMLCAGMLPIL